MKKYFAWTLCLLFVSHQIFAQQKPLSSLLKSEANQRTNLTSTLDLTPVQDSKKSVLLAVCASLLVPGLGEWYVGSLETGKYQMIAEGGLWLTYAGFRIHANWLQQDAETFARQHAGANFNNKDDQYYVNIGNYNTTDEYNAAKGVNREYDLVYYVNEHPDYQWNWDSDANRLNFKDMRIHSGEVKNRAKFMIGAIVVNHLLSAFLAGKQAAAYNRSISSLEKVEIHTYAINYGPGVDGWGIRLSTTF